MKRRSDRLAIFDGMSQACSVDLTKRYSTSFSKSIGALGKDIQQAIFSIYGFVRLADEVVDSGEQITLGPDEGLVMKRFTSLTMPLTCRYA